MSNHAISTSASVPTIATKLQTSSPSPSKKHSSVFSELPEAKRRKFILVDDTEGKTRVRVKVNLESVEIAEIPDSYRRKNSVYPRSWRPTEMPPSPRDQRARRVRFVEDDVEDGVEGQREGLGVAEMGTGIQAGRVTVPVQMLDKGEGRLNVPGLGRRAHEREDKLNDLGYRISWGQSRVFAGRVLFLQKSRESHPPLVNPENIMNDPSMGILTEGLQWTRIETRSAAPWLPAAKTSRLWRHILRRGWGRRCGWRERAKGSEDSRGLRRLD